MCRSMGCRIMCGKALTPDPAPVGCTKRSERAFTLPEMLIAAALGSLVLMAVGAFVFYSSRALAAAVNYVDLDQQSQFALDKFALQVRQVNGLTSYTTTNSLINSLSFQDYDGGTLSFTYDPGNGTLTRSKGGVSELFLTNCD